MAIKVITPPSSEPVTLTQAKSQSRVDISTDDTLLNSYIAAARRYCERVDWRAYMTQTLEVWLDEWPSGNVLTLPRPPLQSVTYIKYYDEDSIEATFSSAAYYVDTVSEPGRVMLKSDYDWPSATLREVNGVVVRFIAGWTSADNVPETIRQAILLVIGHWYENREGVLVGTVSKEIELGVTRLLDIERAMRF